MEDFNGRVEGKSFDPRINSRVSESFSEFARRTYFKCEGVYAPGNLIIAYTKNRYGGHRWGVYIFIEDEDHIELILLKDYKAKAWCLKWMEKGLSYGKER